MGNIIECLRSPRSQRATRRQQTEIYLSQCSESHTPRKEVTESKKSKKKGKQVTQKSSSKQKSHPCNKREEPFVQPHQKNLESKYNPKHKQFVNKRHDVKHERYNDKLTALQPYLIMTTQQRDENRTVVPQPQVVDISKEKNERRSAEIHNLLVRKNDLEERKKMLQQKYKEMFMQVDEMNERFHELKQMRQEFINVEVEERIQQCVTKKEASDHAKTILKCTYHEVICLSINPPQESDYEELQKLAIKNWLTDLLTLPTTEDSSLVTESDDRQKEQYKPFGLLLSACKLKDTPLSSEQERKLLFEVKNRLRKYEMEEVVFFLKSSLRMTRSMLFLLPPLVICTPYFQEDIYDTNRVTWNEDWEDRAVYFYRPVLVYGNELHIAVRGLIGNEIDSCKQKKETISDRETTIQ